MKDCLFCKIANKEIPGMTVYEDDICYSFLDINPDSDGHTLIIPKKHYKDINDIDEDVLLHIYKTSKKIMNTLKEKLNCDGFILQQNNGSVQEVKHYHLHIKPYYSDKPSVKMVKNESLVSDPKDVYEKIKEA